MGRNISADQIVGAARELGQPEFTRGDVAAKLGVEKPELKKAFRVARRDGRLDKVRDDADNVAHFELTE
jgi:hypothetical protein